MGKLSDSDLFEPISLDMNEFSVMLIPLVQLFVPGINRRQVVVSSRLRVIPVMGPSEFPPMRELLGRVITRSP